MNFWCIFEPHFFRVYYFSSKQEAYQEMLPWAESEWNHVWLSPQLLKISFTTSCLQDSNPLPSIFHSELRFWLLKMVTHQKNLYLGWTLIYLWKLLTCFNTWRESNGEWLSQNSINYEHSMKMVCKNVTDQII